MGMKQAAEQTAKVEAYHAVILYAHVVAAKRPVF